MVTDSLKTLGVVMVLVSVDMVVVMIGGLEARDVDVEEVIADLMGLEGDAVLGEVSADVGKVFDVAGDGLHWIGLRWWLVVNCLTERSIDYAQ